MRHLKERGFAIMAESQQYAWQKQSRETDKAYQPFVTYRNLDSKERSLARVGSELVKSRTPISRWSAHRSWIERARAWDDYQERRRLKKRIEEKQKMEEEHLEIIRSARSKAIEALTQMSVEQLATNVHELRNWITEFVRHERLVMGEPETIEVRREKIELQATIEEKLKSYAPVFQELIDEGAIRLDGHHELENGEDEIFNYDGPDDEKAPGVVCNILLSAKRRWVRSQRQRWQLFGLSTCEKSRMCERTRESR